MLNQVIVVGRLANNPEIIPEERKIANITLAVPRSFKNAYGEYETDFISCTLLQGIVENVVEYCHKGDLIEIKGRLQNNENKLELIAEKVTFLSKKKADE